MTLKVYVITKDGRKDVIEYGMDVTNYKKITKVEMCYDTSKVKMEMKV